MKLVIWSSPLCINITLINFRFVLITILKFRKMFQFEVSNACAHPIHSLSHTTHSHGYVCTHLLLQFTWLWCKLDCDTVSTTTADNTQHHSEQGCIAEIPENCCSGMIHRWWETLVIRRLMNLFFWKDQIGIGRKHLSVGILSCLSCELSPSWKTWSQLCGHPATLIKEIVSVSHIQFRWLDCTDCCINGMSCRHGKAVALFVKQ